MAMWMLAFATLLALAATGSGQTPPKFASQYTVEGVIKLPYAEIEEDFSAYVDLDRQRSRVDYYGDLVKTVQDSSSNATNAGGVSYKLAWMTDPLGQPQRTCFKVDGSPQVPIAPTSVLPDLSQYAFGASETCPPSFSVATNEVSCNRWDYNYTEGEKANRYQFWTAQSNGAPVRFYMEGYDTLLGSHYDKYEILYKNYVEGPVGDDVFNITSNLTCHGFPGPGIQNVALHNPIREFIDHPVANRHNDEQFEHFKAAHGKNYSEACDHEYRKHIFRHNYRYIESKNRQLLHYKLRVNHLADWTEEERRSLRGKRFSNTTDNGGLEYAYKYDQFPLQWDWRLLGAVTPVKDQAVCGSCWSFGTTGTVEGQYFVKHGHLPKLSQQQLIDCSWQWGNNGCDGGEDFRAYGYILKAGGLATELDYGHYMGQDGKCHDAAVPKTVQITGFYNVTSGDENALRSAIYSNGPVTVAIDAAHNSLAFYSHGIYYEPDCGNKPENMDHQVLAVGYGELLGQRYWLVKNSWSTYWGNDGYVLMSSKDNNCGVMTQPTFPIVK